MDKNYVSTSWSYVPDHHQYFIVECLQTTENCVYFNKASSYSKSEIMVGAQNSI